MQNQCNAKFYYDQYKYVLCNSDKQKKSCRFRQNKAKMKKQQKKPN